MDGALNPIERQLVKEYRNVYVGSRLSLGDQWIDVEPAIPFVGGDYGAGGLKRVLVYGSAENLNFQFDATCMTHARNRIEYEAWREKPGAHWFPRIHMAPASDGTLPLVTRYLLDALGDCQFSTIPNAFIEQIAIGNYGKFSLKGTNKDYASNPDLLSVSDRYVLADLTILKPNIVIVPRTIHLHALKRLLQVSEHQPEWILRIYQTNPGVINRQIRHQLSTAGIADPTTRTEWVQEWLDHVPRKIRMDRYLDWIDWRLGRIKGLQPPDWVIAIPG